MPVEAHIKEHPGWFGRFEAVWTPTVLLLDSKGKERVRLEGYVSRTDFNAWLQTGLGRMAFVRKQFDEAEGWYGQVAAESSQFAPEATYWRSVAHYSGTHDHTALAQVEAELREKFPGSVWAEKALPWRQ
ncbi:MAG: hypothetical protein ACRD04_03015 [Terriglobales bacterium]